MRSTPAMLQVACVLLASIRAVHGGLLTANLTFVQQPQPDARGFFAPVIRVEAEASVHLEAMKAMVGLRIGAGSPAAAGDDCQFIHLFFTFHPPFIFPLPNHV